MELQSQHGSGGSLVVIQQPSLEGRLDRLDYEREFQHAAILSLDQIKAIRSNNEYTEGPSVARRPAAPRVVVAPRPEKHESTHEIILVNVNNNYEHRHHHHHHPVGQHYNGRAPGLSRSTSTGSAASSGSNSSASSEQGLLVRSPPSRLGSAHHHNHHHHHSHRHHHSGSSGVSSHHHHHNHHSSSSNSSSHHRVDRPVRTQPKSLSLASQQQQLLLQHLDAPLKPSAKAGPGGGSGTVPSGLGDASSHQFICERCGKCKCAECTAPRTLPSCLACNGQCLCSADSVVEHGTCMCLVKGLFYHCSNRDDDEGDSCADHPCSLSRSHCCSRFLCMGLMSALFPCLLCYPPARGCVKACQDCHDRVNRPGCRCKNSNTVYCKLESWPPQAPEKPS